MKRCFERVGVYAVILCLFLSACSQKEPVVTWQEQYDLGIRYLSEGNYEEAVIAFTAAIEIAPKRADAYIGLSDVYTLLGKPDEALRVLNDALVATQNDSSIVEKIKIFEDDGISDAAGGGDEENMISGVSATLDIFSEREGALSIHGIDVSGSYDFSSVSTDTRPDYQRLVQWWVTLHGAESTIAVWTGLFKYPGLEVENVLLEDMQSSVSWYDDSGVDHTIGGAGVSITSDGLEWNFHVPTEYDGNSIPFSLYSVTELEITIYDILQGGVIYHGSSYVA